MPAPPPPWQPHAACASVPDPDAWFPTPEDAVDPLAGDWLTTRPWTALALCATCPVALACLTLAIQAPGTRGIWGGRTPLERDLLRLDGWTPGDPLPPRHRGGTWVPVAQASRSLGIARRTIHAWAAAHEVSSRTVPSPTGQPARLVSLEEVRARAARAHPARFRHPRKATA